MDMPTNGKGSLPPLEKAEVSSVSEVKQKVRELVDLINRLPSDHESQRDKSLELELQQQKALKTYYQTQCNELLENKILLEKRVRELEAANLTRNNNQISILQQNLEKAERAFQTLQNEHKILLQSKQKLLMKHEKLREFVKVHLSQLQTLTGHNLASTTESPNNLLASMSAYFARQLKNVESRRKVLQKRVITNSKLTTAIIKLMQIRNHTRIQKVQHKLRCRLCSRKFLTREKFLSHRRLIHTVQRSKKYLRKKSVSQRKLTVKLAKTFGGSIEKWNVVPLTSPKTSTTDMHQKLSGDAGNMKICNIKVSAAPMGSTRVSTGSKSVSNSENELGVPSAVGTGNKHRCRVCGNGFPTMHLLREHGENFHGMPKSAKKRKLGQQDNQAKEPVSPRKSSERIHNRRMFVSSQKHGVDRSKRLGFYCRCGSSYRSAQLLNDHIRYFTRAFKFECPVAKCLKRFAYLAYLRRHVKLSHKNKSYLKNLARGCSDCGECFATAKEHYSHRREKHSDASHSQERRSRNSKSGFAVPQQNPDASLNLNNGNPGATTIAEDVNLPPIFSSVPTTPISTVYPITKQHAFSYSAQPSTYFCKCGLAFENMDTLGAHVRYYGLGKKFLCSHCEILFPSMRDTNVHIGKCDAVSQKRCVSCSLCGVVFADRNEYRNHMVFTDNGSTRKENWVCPMRKLATMKMKNQRKVRSSQASENSDKTEVSIQAAINQCAPNLPAPSSLPNPNFEINLVLKFVCRVCEKRFLFAYTLRKHMISAHKIVENLGVGCQNCGDFFLDHMELLKHHKMVHNTGVSPEEEMKYVPPTRTVQ